MSPLKSCTALLFSLLVAGCASTPRQELHQAASMPAPAMRPPTGAPPYRPQESGGLPGERIPGQQPRTLPKSPNKRILAASDEPGWWKADDLRASKAGPADLFGLPLPTLRGTPADAKLNEKCAAQMKRWFDTSVPQSLIDALNRSGGDVAAKYRCLAGRLFWLCFTDDYQRNRARWNAGKGWKLSEATPDAQRPSQEHCTEETKTPEVLAIEKAIREVMGED